MNKEILDRLKTELKELEERVEKLSNFIISDEYKSLDKWNKYYLKEQQEVMFHYCDILRRRIYLHEKDNQR